MSKEEIFQAGIAAVKSGDLAQAASLFAQVVKIDPSSEQGWLWLGICCSTSNQRAYCFRRVLALNPDNPEARRQLERLSKPAPVPPPPARVSQPPPIDTTSTPKSPPAYTTTTPEPSTLIAPPVSPFAYYDEELVSTEQDELPPPPVVAVSPKVDKPKTAGAQRKKSNTKLILALIFGPTLIACVLGIPFFIILSGTPGFPLLFSTKVPTRTLVPPSAISSPTPAPPTAIPSPMPTLVYTPLLESVPCPFDAPSGANVSCSYVIVPEDRTGDPSHTIRLAVAVYHSKSDIPAEPVVFLQGGPGAEAVQLTADAYDFLVSPFLSERDFIVFDQRGTGLSKPALGCEELTKTYSQDVHGMIPGTTRELVYSNAFLSCNGLMSAQGVNLNAYTTVASAADVKDIFTLLGYQKADLYGASYGTRLAQVIMRDFPEIVHSAILDSVVPVESNLFNKYPDAIGSGLKKLFISCAIDPKCGAAYPNLEVVFWELVNQLDANPVTVTTSNYPTGTITETVNGSTVMSVVLGSVKYSPLISTAPQTIYRFRNGDFSTLMIAQSSLPFAFEGISPGLFISMMCHEHILATTLEDLQATATRQNSIREYAWLPFYGDAQDVFKICKSWGAIGPFLGENDPVISDIPSLIITGGYDPTTPPMYAQQIAGQLSHNYYFEFPTLGHTPTAADSTGCAMDIAVSFLDDPTAEPDRSCLDDLDNIDFVVPYTGNPALSLKKVREWGVTFEVPKDWYSIGEGFYFRGNSLLDLTTAGVVRTYLSSTQLHDWLSLEAYGYRGLDSAPIEAGQRHANGMTWTLYTDTSNGRPVDIAMADYGGQSLVVMLFCNSDEHDALYRTVFLPMVDSARIK